MLRVLLVDDDPDILETLRFALEHEGFEVETAPDGLAALRAARSRPPAVAVLDVMLPGMNGYDVSRYLKQDMRSGRLQPFAILMLTARQVHSSVRQEFLSTWSQADVSMWKPFDLAVLIGRVRDLAGNAAGLPAHSGGPA
jgi:two-component system OmpR family response regulator